MMTRKTANWASILLALLVLGILARHAGADTNLITSGTWNVPSNWSNGLPTFFVNAYVDNNFGSS